MIGYIYILRNPSFPDLLKIGLTGRTPEERASELSGTGLPFPYEIVCRSLSEDVERDEAEIHSRLEAKRVNQAREFFRVSLEEAQSIVDIVCTPSHSSKYSSLLTEIRRLTVQNDDLTFIVDRLRSELSNKEATLEVWREELLRLRDLERRAKHSVATAELLRKETNRLEAQILSLKTSQRTADQFEPEATRKGEQ